MLSKPLFAAVLYQIIVSLPQSCFCLATTAHVGRLLQLWVAVVLMVAGAADATVEG